MHPWFTVKTQIAPPGQRRCYKQAKYTLEKEIRVAKRNYIEKLRIEFSSNDTASVWKGLKDITNYKTPSPSTVENQQLADYLNEFYCRFEKTPLTPLATPLSPTPALQISEDDVRQVLRKNKRRKEQERKSTRPRRCHTSLSENLCWPAGPHLHTDLQQITGAVRSPFLLQTLHHHPHPKETQNYWT